MRKSGRLALLLILNLFVLSIFVLHGCSRIRIRTHSNTASLQTVQGDLEFARSQVEETDEALDELTVTPAEDLKQAYRVFATKVEKMGTIGDRLVRHANGMRDNGGDYLVETEKSATQCRFPRLSEHAGAQPLQLGEAFKPIYESSKEVRYAYRAYYFDISNIRDQLSRNMTLKSIESMDLLFRKAQADSESLTEALNQELGAVQAAKPGQKGAAGGVETQAGSAPGGDIQSSPGLGGDIQSSPEVGEDR